MGDYSQRCRFTDWHIISEIVFDELLLFISSFRHMHGSL